MENIFTNLKTMDVRILMGIYRASCKQ